MRVEVSVPEVGESVHEIEIGRWLKQPGEYVEEGQDLVEIETDKASLEIPAPISGTLTEIVKGSGAEARVGDVIAYITSGSEASSAPPAAEPERPKAEAEPRRAPEPEPKRDGEVGGGKKKKRRRTAQPAESPRGTLPGPVPAESERAEVSTTAPRETSRPEREESRPRAAQPAAEQRSAPARAPEPPSVTEEGGERGPGERAVPMSLMRRRIAERLVSAQQNAALLTTFNEVDMSTVMEMRREYGDAFQKKYGVKLGFMGFFVKGVVAALRQFPEVNAEIRGKQIIYRDHCHVGIAVGGGKGLVVPVLRNAELMSFAQIENTINELAARARENRLEPEDLLGGTFTISNGGIYGSLLSTPIVNPPQSGILGMHAIQERPVARDGQVVIRPMMYLALTYDHRLVDGREAVTFLRTLKEMVESPARLALEV